MAERRFTPAEVNRLIPELERIIAYLRKLDAEIQAKDWQLRQAKVEARRRGEKIDSFTFLKEEAEIEFLRILARGPVERIRELGGEIRSGYLVDFPARIGGRDVLLCWRPGETEIRWYHSPEEGMMVRQPIPEDLLEEDK